MENLKVDEYLIPNASFERLLREYETHGSLLIGFDFDNTVYDFHQKGATYEMVIELLRELNAIDCKLICWTASNDLEFVKEYLTINNIPFDGINSDGVNLGYKTRKPFYSTILDDRTGLLQVYRELKTLVYVVRLKRLKNSENDRSA